MGRMLRPGPPSDIGGSTLIAVPCRQIQGVAYGAAPDVLRVRRVQAGRMPRFLVHHRHAPHECGIAYVSFKGCDSTVRHRPAIASCAFGGHAIWWTVEARDAEQALSDLPFFVAQRSAATRVAEIVVP